jgi:hypothetical protein
MPEVNRVIDERLAGTFTTQLAQAIEGVRGELRTTVTQMVREAVAASVVRAVSGREDPSRRP